MNTVMKRGRPITLRGRLDAMAPMNPSMALALPPGPFLIA
jgi:hypothetical protein